MTLRFAHCDSYPHISHSRSKVLDNNASGKNSLNPVDILCVTHQTAKRDEGGRRACPKVICAVQHIAPTHRYVCVSLMSKSHGNSLGEGHKRVAQHIGCGLWGSIAHARARPNVMLVRVVAVAVAGEHKHVCGVYIG